MFFDRIHKIFYEEQLLPRSLVKHKLKHELAYRDEWGKGLLIQIYMNGLNRNRIRDFHRSLVFEMLQTVDYSKYFSGDDLLNLDYYQFKTYAQMHVQLKNNYPFYRSISNIYKRFHPQDKNYSLRSYEEIGDSEIIHFGLLGHSSFGEFHSVKIFTTEKNETWKSRIKLAKAFVKFINEDVIPKMNQANKESMQMPIMLYPGIIYQVNGSTGEIMDNWLDIQTLD